MNPNPMRCHGYGLNRSKSNGNLRLHFEVRSKFNIKKKIWLIPSQSSHWEIPENVGIGPVLERQLFINSNRATVRIFIELFFKIHDSSERENESIIYEMASDRM